MHKTCVALLVAMLLPVSWPHAQTPAAAVAAVDSNRLFGLDLYKQLVGDEPTANVFVSPLSLTMALSMVTEGARGTTRTQMNRVLHASGTGADSLAALHAGMSALFVELNAAGRGEPAGSPPAAAAGSSPTPYQLEVANALWGDEQYPFSSTYVDTIRRHYGASGIFPVNFLTAAEAARQRVNAWASEQTHGRIPVLLNTGTVNSLTRLVLTNAVYFKGKWVSPFAKRTTMPAPFHVTPTQQVESPLMRAMMTVPYVENDRFQAVSLSYAGRSAYSGDVSMIVVLPRAVDGLRAVEDALTAETLQGLLASNAAVQQVNVFLPTFTVNNGYDLNTTLKAMGMAEAFARGRADFSGISPKAIEDQLHISLVTQKTFVKVDEDGTEAAAATAVAMKGGGRPPDNPPVFRADHPFFYMIRHNPSGAILFMGRMVNPRESGKQ